MNIFLKRSLKIMTSIALVMAVALTTVVTSTVSVQAATVRTGTVVISSGSLNFRSGPGTGYTAVGKLYNGDTGEIIDEAAAASNGAIWYKMVVDGVTGWAHSSYIKVTETASEIDPDFKEYLEAQGFPESYHSALLALHEKYPNWVFKAQHTGLDWEAVIKAESKYGYNTVHDSSSPSSWKSTEGSAYSWVTSTWTEVDSGNWVAASSDIIRYYMDPRNFLDSTYIFQFLEQSYDGANADAKVVKSELTNLVKGTFLAGSYEEDDEEYSYIDVIMKAATNADVSPHMLASMIIQEQGVNGTGRCISGTVAGYEGIYNFFNIGAYKTSSMSAVERGLWYAAGGSNSGTSYNRPWDSREKAIVGGAEYFYKRYISKGQDTLYLKKFNTQGTSPYTNQYMTNVGGAAAEGSHLSQAYNAEARTAALVFKIPVFENMPEQPAEKPVKDGSPNNKLKDLAVSDVVLTPVFDMNENSYSSTVSYDVDSVKVTASAYDSTAVISGTGTVNLKIGENTIKVTVVAENKDVRTYTITITREAPPEFTGQRIYGENRFETSLAIADVLKEAMDIDCFDSAIIASGTNFPDALSGSYLAKVKNAPILLAGDNNVLELQEYVSENVTPGSIVYILGGEKAVSSDVDQAIETAGYEVVRLAGETRYETNLKILAEAEVKNEDVLICTGDNFADSLSASAAKRPILLVDDTLTEPQKAFLENVAGEKYIIGGTSAVSQEIEDGIGDCTRVFGNSRYATSVAIAETFFVSPDLVVLASGTNFPDGLCGGPFACEIDAPLILAAKGNEAAAKEYVSKYAITNGIVLGGTAAVPDHVAGYIMSE